MVGFLLKGLFRDRSRSLFPVLIVAAGSLLTVLMYSWMKGQATNMVDATATFATGHVKVVTRAAAESEDLLSNDLALVGVADLLGELRDGHPEMVWTPRIKFGGLLDIPDEQGETRAQGPVAGFAVDLFSRNTPEHGILRLETAVVRGRMPQRSGEILISEEFAAHLGVEPGETATLISSTMFGSMTTHNFIIAGTIRFGISAMDRGAMIADIEDVRVALNMEDAAAEILGYSSDLVYRDEQATALAADFNRLHAATDDEFAPTMATLRQSSGMAQMFALIEQFGGIIVAVFVAVMSIVLWNAGLMGNLRRYGEIGLRLAIGEYSGHIYRSMIVEALAIGVIGSVLGTGLGLGISYYLQAHGIDISSMMRNATILMGEKMRARVSTGSYIIGFIPGLAATLLGSAISGITILRRKTSQLTKELEA